MKKINIIQFLPYFPPHKWWLETVAEEFSYFYVKKWFWEVINIVFDVWQDYYDKNLDYIKNKRLELIWYKKNWYTVYLLPSLDIIPNFPFPKFWERKFWQILKIIWNKNYLIQTHTRFFLSSFLWWLFAKYHKLKWVHVEHWSDYVKLWSNLKSKIAYIYDRLIWKWIFKKADKIIAISNWVKIFIQNEFIKNKEINIIYNWINFNPLEKINNWNIIRIWFVWRLVKLKWVDLLVEAFINLSKKYENIFLEIIWDWEEKSELKEKINFLWIKNIKFLWGKTREEVATFLSWIDILINPSFQEWLPTTVLEWLLSKCIVVATDVWWTKEISKFEDLIIIEKWDKEKLERWIEKAILYYKDNSWKSYDYVKEKFEWDENVKLYFNLYEKINIK
jgi:glycosyltransferase involved in cell wall biosynthesis